MIVRPKPHWFRMLFVWHGSVLGKLVPRLLLVLCTAIAAVPLHGYMVQRVGADFGPQPFTLIGISLAVFMGFRNSASYERYWEARKLWGGLFAAARGLARQGLSLVQPLALDEQRRVLMTLAAFAHALRLQLREGARSGELPAPLDALLPADLQPRVRAVRDKPAMVLHLLGEQVGRWRTEGRVSDVLVASFDRNLDHLGEVLSGCERIAGTPIPMPYAVMLHRTVYLFCLLLPFGLVGTIGSFTPLFTVFVAYTFLALEALNDELEDPFGTLPNDLPLQTLCDELQAGLGELLGEPAPPHRQAGADYVLL